jgi:hypothetical protein
MSEKVFFEGTILIVQPRIRLLRSFDQVHHNYLGYVLLLEGRVGQKQGTFSIGVGKAAHAKHQFRIGDKISGMCQPVMDEVMESVGYYKVSGLKVMRKASPPSGGGPPFHHLAPPLEEYRGIGHHRLDPKRYETKCSSCIWGCRMPVVITVDHWSPEHKKYRFETFCYGPGDCRLYVAGRKRTVPGRGGMSHVEEMEDREVRGGKP